MSSQYVLKSQVIAQQRAHIEKIVALETENKELKEKLSKLRLDVRAAMNLANRRWSEWGERAVSVAEALDAALDGKHEDNDNG